LLAFFGVIAQAVDRFLAFELSVMFNPATGLERLELRDRSRPDFVLYTGNDLAADMIEYGSDYLLGLSTFAPEIIRGPLSSLGRRKGGVLGDARLHPVPWLGRIPPAGTRV
jgi:hypothetical protein